MSLVLSHSLLEEMKYILIEKLIERYLSNRIYPIKQVFGKTAILD